MDAAEAVETVTRYLRLVEARDLDAATPYLAPEVVITYPGGRIYRDLRAQFTSSSGRFRSICKAFEQFDVITEAGGIVIYVFGTLQGEDIQGGHFSDVRFIDRFVLREGLIVDHRVWNDLAEHGVVGPS